MVVARLKVKNPARQCLELRQGSRVQAGWVTLVRQLVSLGLRIAPQEISNVLCVGAILAQCSIEPDDVDGKPVKGIRLGVKGRACTADQKAHDECGQSAD